MTELRMAEPDGRPFFTIKSLAQRLAVSQRTVENLVSSGQITSYTIGTARRIDPDDVDSYLARRRDDRRAA